ncbi:MAG: cytochrome c biogenesis protein CcmE [Legionellales bacterium RIFCSPHIGHO2_12_FULL_35_11]|nr:MAG: cytochrome c biogenesis protein CcmE [Legionellales bacterium RIFCSPHIGHO2_12_FULL_35_11]
MHHLRKRRLNVIILMLLVLGSAITLVMYALRQNISLFYSPSELVKQHIPTNKLIRVGGLVVPGSVYRSTKSLLVKFKVTDNKESINIVYKGVLPDLFREGQSIVTQGYMEGNEFRAIEVLAKHDENYMPPEVKKAIILADINKDNK